MDLASFGLISVGLGLAWARFRLDVGLGVALSLTLTRIFAHSSFSIGSQSSLGGPRTCYDFLGLATALIVDLLPLATLPPSITS